MKRTTTSVLLSIIALALVVIAVRPMGPKAEAQPQVEIAPRLVGVTSPNSTSVYRAWSDGLVEWQRVTSPSVCNDLTFCVGWQAVPE